VLLASKSRARDGLRLRPQNQKMTPARSTPAMKHPIAAPATAPLDMPFLSLFGEVDGCDVALAMEAVVWPGTAEEGVAPEVMLELCEAVVAGCDTAPTTGPDVKAPTKERSGFSHDPVFHLMLLFC
jgi:hypothetical protein